MEEYNRGFYEYQKRKEHKHMMEMCDPEKHKKAMKRMNWELIQEILLITTGKPSREYKQWIQEIKQRMV